MSLNSSRQPRLSPSIGATSHQRLRRWRDVAPTLFGHVFAVSFSQLEDNAYICAQIDFPAFVAFVALVTDHRLRVSPLHGSYTCYLSPLHAGVINPFNAIITIQTPSTQPFYINPFGTRTDFILFI